MAKKPQYVDGMPLKTVIGMLKSKETPPWIKKAWEKKLKNLKMPTEAKRLEKLI